MTDLISFATQRRYGVLDQKTAGRWGYHLPRDDQAIKQYAVIDRWKRTLRNEERLALEGNDGTGGCYGSATRALAKGVQQGDGGLLTALDFESLKRSRSQPRVVQAFKAWQACVAGYGLGYADPNAAMSDRAWDLNAPRPSAAEIRTAQADVECKARTRLIETWLGVEGQLQHGLIEQSASQLRRIEEAKHAYLANARHALAS